MNRLAVVAVAGLVALASGVGLVRYVGGAEERAIESAAPVAVLMATGPLADGAPFDQAWEDGTIVVVETLRASRPTTAITDPAALRGGVADGALH